jgi:hypothetical protein
LTLDDIRNRAAALEPMIEICRMGHATTLIARTPQLVLGTRQDSPQNDRGSLKGEVKEKSSYRAEGLMY